MTRKNKLPPLLLNELTAISPLDGRYWDKVFDLSNFTSEQALIRARFEVEAKYLIELSKFKVIRKLSSKEINFLEQLSSKLTIKQIRFVKTIENLTKHDTKAVEKAFKKFLRGTTLDDLIEKVHFAITSEDVNNVSYRVLIKRATENVCIPVLNFLIDNLINLASDYKNLPMIARTHGQRAVPTTLGKELINFAVRLNKEVQKLQSYKLTGKINGAVGNYNSFTAAYPKVNWIAFSKSFVMNLELEPNLFTTQINPYDDLIEIFQIYQRINNIVLDLNQDCWRYISDGYFSLKNIKGEVGSSTMPQKINPIDFENSAGNIKLSNGLLSVFVANLAVSRLQRDLEDSTIIRNFGTTLAYALLAYKKTTEGIKRIEANPDIITRELNQDWSFLGEGVQQILRTEGVKDPYSKVAEFVKGKRVDERTWKEWVLNGLDVEISEQAKSQIQNLTPSSYTGKAQKLTELAIKEIKRSRKL